ncbi:hypothetical protein [Breznakia pachnodae]|uniref:Lipoprotein n=1 Tax=Breznakia pachnodae TaxID=265178 RepID=A0ABU0E6P3_9FIRM|nr:hypothetical protein [Breznakia pachnodae]MDQ0362579.1 hypothetical protein [Breznakia pachnodae]
MIKVIKRILMMIILVLLAVACSNHKLTEGEVYEKEYKPESYTTQLIPMSICNGDSCTTYLQQYVYYYPERYAIHIKAFSEEDNEWIYDTYYVNETQFNEIVIGSQFIYDEELHLDEEPYTRSKD